MNKAEIKQLYLKGYNAVEISKKVSASVEAVRKCIQRNFKDLKYEHDIAVIQRKEQLRAINYESNRYISDRAFILSNRSIYKTLSNGDIVLNKDIAGIVTTDTPKRLINDNKCRELKGWFYV